MSSQTAASGWTVRQPRQGLLHRLRVNWDFFATYVGNNFASALEYRTSFITQVGSMILNDLVWIVFWSLYFTRFPVVSGWGLYDVMTVWGVLATGFGIGNGIFGNSAMLAGMIARGELDFYLTLPKNTLLHVLISRMSVPAWGDVIFGVVLYFAFVRPSPQQSILFVVLSLLIAIMIVSFAVLMESLAFFVGGAEGFSQQILSSLIAFAQYPISIFDGVVKVILFTLIPAGFISYVPVTLMRQFDWELLLTMTVFTLSLMVLSWRIFYLGLRRYESGNLIGMRS